MKRVPQLLWSLKALWQNALQVLGEEEMDLGPHNAALSRY